MRIQGLLVLRFWLFIPIHRDISADLWNANSFASMLGDMKLSIKLIEVLLNKVINFMARSERGVYLLHKSCT